MRLRIIPVMLCVLALASCNMPLSPRAGASTADVQATLAAKARALVNRAGTLTAPPIPVTGATATPGTVQVSVTSPTNCRTGPSVADDLVFLVYTGHSFPVIGKYTPGDYWIIDTPSGGICWLWGRYAILSGNADTLPEYPAPSSPLQGVATATATGAVAPAATDTLGPPPTDTATPTAAPTIPPVLPDAPGNLRQSYACSSITSGSATEIVQDISLTWKDSAGETGYRIYENGNAITMLPQNSTAYHIQLRYAQAAGGAANTFGVEAYNNQGASQRSTIDVPRCP